MGLTWGECFLHLVGPKHSVALPAAQLRGS